MSIYHRSRWLRWEHRAVWYLDTWRCNQSLTLVQTVAGGRRTREGKAHWWKQEQDRWAGKYSALRSGPQRSLSLARVVRVLINALPPEHEERTPRQAASWASDLRPRHCAKLKGLWLSSLRALLSQPIDRLHLQRDTLALHFPVLQIRLPFPSPVYFLTSFFTSLVHQYALTNQLKEAQFPVTYVCADRHGGWTGACLIQKSPSVCQEPCETVRRAPPSTKWHVLYTRTHIRRMAELKSETWRNISTLPWVFNAVVIQSPSAPVNVSGANRNDGMLDVPPYECVGGATFKSVANIDS